MTTKLVAALCGLALVSGMSVARADGPGCCNAPACGCNSCGCNNGGCNNCCGGEKECVCVPTTKKIPHTCYGCKCIDFCIAHNTECHDHCGCGCCCCPEGGGLFGFGCCPCPTVCPGCEHPRVRKALVKWVHVQECPTFKCEVRCACCPGPCCGKNGCGGAGGAIEGAPPMPSGAAPVPPSARANTDETR